MRHRALTLDCSHQVNNTTVSKRRAPEEVAAEERGIKAAIAALGLTNAVDEASNDDGGSARLVLSEFVTALVRVAWHAFPRGFHMEAAGGDADSESSSDQDTAKDA